MGLVNKQMVNTCCFFLGGDIFGITVLSGWHPGDTWFYSFLVRICATGLYFQRLLFALIFNLNVLGLGHTEFG